MKTKFPYGKIDFQSYFDAYLKREDAVTSLPTEAELNEIARKSLLKGQLVLAPVPAGEAAREGDSLTLSVVSELPKFNKPQVRVNVGRGLYDKTLEAALVGAAVGERCHVVIKDKDVTATVLEIRRKQIPEPTDEMVQALQLKDFHQHVLATVEEYEAFVAEQKTMEALATVNYGVMEDIQKDYPLTEFDEDDLRVLRELERDRFAELFREEKGIDVAQLTREEAQEQLGCDSFDAFLDVRRDWYKIKVQQCLIYLNILDLPCEGKTDPLDHYEVLSELTDRMYEKIKSMLIERSKSNG